MRGSEADETLNNSSAATSQADDATGNSSAQNSTDANSANSSTAQGAKKPGSISEALQGVKLEMPAEQLEGEPEEDSGAKESPTDANAESGQDDSKGDQTQKDGQGAGKEKSDDSADVLFHKRPEWSELTKAVGEDNAKKVRPIFRKLLERETHLNRQVAEMKPTLDVMAELRQHAGDEEGFTNMRKIISDYANNPAGAVPFLEQMLQDARNRAGFTLMSDDLVKKAQDIERRVKSGDLDPEDGDAMKAALLDTERARAGQKQTEAQLQRQTERQQQDREQGAVMARANALNSWEEATRSRDPDFGKVTSDDDPNHGRSIADRVFDGVRLLLTRNAQATPEQLVAEASRIHRLAKGQLGTGTQREQRAVTGQSSSITTKPKPKTMREAMDGVKLRME